MKKILALDLDSVMFPLNTAVIIPALNAAGIRNSEGRPVRKRDVVTFDYGDCLGEQAKAVAMTQFKRPDLYDGWTLAPEVEVVLANLRALYRVIAVSSPFAQHAGSKWRFLQRAGFDHADIFLCGGKSLVQFDVLVDDRPKTAREIGPLRCVVFDQPWNRDLPVREFVRAFGWGDVERKVARLIREEEAYAARPHVRAVVVGDCIHGFDLSDDCPDCGRCDLYDI